MTEGLTSDLWMEYWNMYDWACWSDYLSRPSITKEFKKSEYSLRSYLHDNILVPAIEQIENNLEKVDTQSKFLYWFRFREEYLLITESYGFDSLKELDEQVKIKFEEYSKHISGVIKELRPKVPKYELFKWFYIALCSLKSDCAIYFNEMLFNLPIFNQLETNRKNLDFLERNRKEKIINIYNYGSIDTIINNLENSNSNFFPTLTPKETVEHIIDNFKHQIEDNGLSKLLYESKAKKLRHESSAQQLFFSVAQIFCLANDLDVSPETNSGSGCVDFKFSKGAAIKINVEIKYSNNTGLKHGLENQLGKYDKAEQAETSYYLIIQVDNNDMLIDRVKKIDNEINMGNLKVKVVDGRLQKSASVRQSKD